VAIHTNPVIARSETTWQSIFRWCKTKAGLLRLRLAMTPIYVIARSAATRQSIFRWCETTDGLLRLRLAMTPIYVIARSETTWQSIFQVVQDESWIASPSARNDSGDGSQ